MIRADPAAARAAVSPVVLMGKRADLLLDLRQPYYISANPALGTGSIGIFATTTVENSPESDFQVLLDGVQSPLAMFHHQQHCRSRQMMEGYFETAW